jgi:ATP adenylyltransferase
MEEAKSDAEQVERGQQFLSAYWSSPEEDESNLVIHRDPHGMILLNRYPYANGHLLVALGEARPTLLDYETKQRAAFWSLVEHATDLMQRTLEPQGINFGINQGEAAGAGIPGHLHAHLVPRWHGDTNAMTVVGGTRVVPASLEDMASLYRESSSPS